MANPIRVTRLSVSPLAGIQAIHNRVDSAYGERTVQLAAIVLIVGRSVLRNKLNRIEASMSLGAGKITVIDLLCGESLIVIEIGGLGSWLRRLELGVPRL